MSDPVAALRGQLQQLEARHRSGAIDPTAYDEERTRLERALLDHVLAQPGAGAAGKAGGAKPGAGPATAEAAPRPSWRMTALLSLVVLGISIVGYSITGAPHLATGPVPVAQPEGASPHEMSGEQFAAAVDSLAERLKSEPDNAEGWAILARSYVRLGRVEQAVPAFAKAVSLAGDDPRLLADYADALAVQNDRNLEGEPTRLIDRALKIEPDNLKALALAGTAAFNRKDYPTAVKHWERMAVVAPPDSPWRQQLQSSIAEARQLGGLGPSKVAAAPAATMPTAPTVPAMPAPAAPPTASPATPAADAAAGTTLRGTVRLAAALAAKAAPEDTVFVLARAAEGPRMPLAIVRAQVKDLPLTFALDDRMAMSPAMKLSLFPKVVIDARVSKSGQAQPSAGDLAGRTPAIAHDASGVVVEINEVVKN